LDVILPEVSSRFNSPVGATDDFDAFGSPVQGDHAAFVIPRPFSDGAVNGYGLGQSGRAVRGFDSSAGDCLDEAVPDIGIVELASN